MSVTNSLFIPKEKIIHNGSEIGTHFSQAATTVDRITISFNSKVVQANFGFVQRFRKMIPIINVSTNKRPPLQTNIRVQYHGMGCCWSFIATIVGYNIEGHWLISIPKRLKKNEARRAPRYFLNENQKWSFVSTQALGSFALRDLSTMGCSIYFYTSDLNLRPKEHLRGMLKLNNNIQVPVMAQVRHISGTHNDLIKKVAGCSFERLSNWGKMQIDEQLQRLPNSDLRRI